MFQRKSLQSCPSGMIFRVLCLLLAGFIAQPSYGQKPQTSLPTETTTLEPGTLVEKEFKTGALENQIYQITLEANQYASLTIEQRSVDVIARVYAADGLRIADVDSEPITGNSEKVELVAEAPGNYRIEIKPFLTKAGAGKYTIRLDEKRAATADEKSLDTARRQYYESLRLNDNGRFEQALDLARYSLEARRKILGSENKAVSATLLALGNICRSKNDLTQAEKYFQQASELITKIYGTNSLSYADLLHGLALVRFGKANFDEALKLNQEALAIREKLLGAESFPVSSSLHNMASVFRSTNDLPKAEQTFLKAVAIREKLVGENNLDLATTLNNFGLFYYGTGDYTNAARLMERSLIIKEKLLPANHRLTGIALNNLGLIAWRSGDEKKATEYYLRALPIFEVSGGVESDGVGSISHNLGILYKESGDNAKAEEYYLKALRIWQKVLGDNHESTAVAFQSLGILYKSMGDLERAEKNHLRAQEIFQKVMGPTNQYTVNSLVSVMKIYEAKGDIARAIEYQQRINAIENKVIPINLTIGSERQKLAYVKRMPRIDRTISLHQQLARDNPIARDLAATVILQRKGRVLDALSDSLSALRRRFNPEDQALLNNLNGVNSRLARLMLSGRQKLSAEEYDSQIAALEGEREKLESEISRRSSGFYQNSTPITLDAIKKEIPESAALIEFAVYRPFDPKADEDDVAYGQPRYVAYVLRRDKEVQWADLGEAKTIEQEIANFRQALRDAKRTDVQKSARLLDEKVMQPLRALMGNATQLLISPDGELNLIPFEALVDEQGKYLIEHYSFNYLTSGRDLLRMKIERESKSNFLVVSNPLFGDPQPTEPTQAIKVSNPTDASPNSKSENISRTTDDIFFAPLSSTVKEAGSIQALFPEAKSLAGAEATESALKEVSAPSILHISTHGFFLPNETEDADSNANTNTENPLLRSGLALAGANKRSSGKDDGILTALEASGLNLWGTKLVVLSACDTGVGEVKNGEGVYGLRRAFMLAGAESLVMSLWAVSDTVTRELMTDYYKNLKAGMGRGAALRQVQLSMLKKPDRKHPFYWAAFIQSGEWANLNEKR